MRQDRLGQRLNIIRQNVVAAIQRGAGLAGAEQRQRTARTGAEINIPAVAGAVSQVNNITFNGSRDT